MRTATKQFDILDYKFTITRTATTNYEQQEQHRQEMLYMTLQKSLGLILIVISIAPVFIYHEPKVLFLTGIIALLGIAVTLTKKHVITL